MKRSFYQAAVAWILLDGCTTWTQTKRLEKKLDGNYTRMLQAILNKSGRQHHTRHQPHGHLPPIAKTIQIRQTRHAGHFWRSRDELISDVLRAKAGRKATTYIQQLCEDTGCRPEDMPEAMNDREKGSLPYHTWTQAFLQDISAIRNENIVVCGLNSAYRADFQRRYALHYERFLQLSAICTSTPPTLKLVFSYVLVFYSQSANILINCIDSVIPQFLMEKSSTTSHDQVVGRKSCYTCSEFWQRLMNRT